MSAFKNNKKARKTPVKFRWHDGEGRKLSAGGILPYDKGGVWVIREKNKDNSKITEVTDMGGKYQFEDCDIFGTAAREFCEELYYSTLISRDDVELFSHTPVYINGHDRRPAYVCYLIGVEELEACGAFLSIDAFDRKRQAALKSNPNVPSSYFSSLSLEYILYEDLFYHKLSYRLKKILDCLPERKKKLRR